MPGQGELEQIPSMAEAVSILRRSSIPGLTELARALEDVQAALAGLNYIIQNLEAPIWEPRKFIGGTSEENAPLRAYEDGTVVLDGSIILPGTVNGSTVIAPGSITTGLIAADAITSGLIAAGAVTASEIAANAISAVNIVANAITVAKLNITAILVEGLAVSDNTPSAGRVAWSACTVWKDGASYAISSGDTDKKFVYWVVGDGTFTAADDFTPSRTRYSILSNSTGVYDVLWNKVGLAHLQRSNLAFGLIVGVQPQPPAYLAFTPNFNVDTDATILNVTNNAGGIFRFNFEISTLSATANCRVKLRVNVDGAGWFEAILFDVNAWHGDGQGISSVQVGTGQALGDRLSIEYGFSFAQSVQVVLRHRYLGAPADVNGFRFWCWYGLEV